MRELEIEPHKDERLSYRGYMVEIAESRAGWSLGIYPSSPDLPILANCTFNVALPLREDVLSIALSRIDHILRT